MVDYNLYPAVDSTYAFPPVVRDKAAHSPEMDTRFSSERDTTNAKFGTERDATNQKFVTERQATNDSVNAAAAAALGVYGIGGTSKDVSNGDWNTPRPNGMYMGLNMASAPANSGDWHFVLHEQYSTDYIMQTAVPFTDGHGSTLGAVWTRVKTGGAWHPWGASLVGNAVKNHTAQSWNNIKTTGIYNVNRGGGDAGAANYPANSGAYGQLIVFDAANESVTQIFADGGHTFYRQCYDGGWSAWQVYANLSDIQFTDGTAGLGWANSKYGDGRTQLKRQSGSQLVLHQFVYMSYNGFAWDETILYLPQGYRPQQEMYTTAVVYNGGWQGLAGLRINTDGRISVETGVTPGWNAAIQSANAQLMGNVSFYQTN